MTLWKSYCFYRSSQCRSGLLLALSSHQQPISDGGFSQVELLVVVVSLGVLSAVSIPAYFAQTRLAHINAANTAVLAAAKSCAAAQISSGTPSFSPDRGVIGACGANSLDRDFTSDSRYFSLSTAAKARVASSTGAVTLETQAS